MEYKFKFDEKLTCDNCPCATHTSGSSCGPAWNQCNLQIRKGAIHGVKIENCPLKPIDK